MSRMLLTTKGTGGDVGPLLSLGCRLRKRGHAVTLFSHCQYADLARRAGLEFVALDTPEEFAEFIEDGHLINVVLGFPRFVGRQILPKVQAECAQIEELIDSEQTVVVAKHLSDIAARCAAEKRGVPFVRVFMAPSQIAGMPLLVELCRSVFGPAINRARAELGLPVVQDWDAWLCYKGPNIGP